MIFPPACCDDNSIVRSNQAETADDKFSCDDNNNHPRRKLVQLYKADQCRAYQQLICQRIHKLSEIGNQIVTSCNVAVQSIRDAGSGKDYQCNPFGRASAHARQQEEHEKRNHNYPQNR